MQMSILGDPDGFDFTIIYSQTFEEATHKWGLVEFATTLQQDFGDFKSKLLLH